MSVDFGEVKPIVRYCVNTEALTVRGACLFHVVIHWTFLIALTVGTSLQIEPCRDYPQFIPI
jgi:hypothetical protein